MKILNAFSLIELMVVIAVAAILAAVALPLYRDYQIRVKIRSAIPLVHKIKTLQTERYAKTGSFTNAFGLGLTNTNPPYTALNPTSLNRYLAGLYVNLACNSTGAEITLEFSNAALGYSGSESIVISYLVRPSATGNTTYLQCIYRTDGTSMTANLAARLLPAQCQTPLGNPSLVTCPALP